MSGELQTALVVGGFGLASTIVGAVASYFGAFFLRQKEVNAQRERERLSRRGVALEHWIDAMIDLSGTPGPYPNRPDSPAARVNRANIELLLTLSKEESQVADYVSAVTREISKLTDIDLRMGSINHAGQELVEWHRGLEPRHGFRPFRFHEFGPNSEVLVETLDAWPDRGFRP